ncbi:MAG: glutamate synthase-related protein [archaeon]|nr:glutamate synthase-related protein [archaeon]
MTISKTKDYLLLGDSYWTPEMISKNWYQAETGKIPVSGAGYSGPFSGEGFDAMWTDMSEIVRPTRDGIHGREYISTTVDIGGKLPVLTFDANGALALPIPPTLSIPIPIIFNALPFERYENIYEALARAASYLGTFMMVNPDEWFNTAYKAHIVPLLTTVREDLIRTCKMVEFEYGRDVLGQVKEAKKLNPRTILSVRVPCSNQVEEIAEELTVGGVEVIHLHADINGQTFRKSLIKNASQQTFRKSLTKNASQQSFIKDMTLNVHRHLVDLRIRDDVTLIVSGGIAMAEHVAKSIICGADLTALDLPLLIALECRYCKNHNNGQTLGKFDQNASQPCPIELKGVNPQWGAERIINLIGAWRNQLLEVLGAMGLREVRRLRGEVGRAIFFEDIQKETFDKVFVREGIIG